GEVEEFFLAVLPADDEFGFAFFGFVGAEGGAFSVPVVVGDFFAGFFQGLVEGFPGVSAGGGFGDAGEVFVVGPGGFPHGALVGVEGLLAAFGEVGAHLGFLGGVQQGGFEEDAGFADFDSFAHVFEACGGE